MRMKDISRLREEVEKYFVVYHEEIGEDFVRFYVYPLMSLSELKPLLARLSNEFDVRLVPKYGGLILELREHKEKIWINILLLIATFFTTTFIGATMFENFDIIGGISYSLAIMFVLGLHEMGHYVFARRWGMRTSLPYFIPFPSIIGTLGAIIKHRGAIPSRNALFDVGVAGPLFGIIASIVVVVIGLKIPFHPPKAETLLILGTPPLFELIASVVGYSGEFIHPVAFAGWVGMFVTFLNLIPVGQLDGGHVLRAMIGKKAEKISRFIPITLIGLGFITSKVYGSGAIWFFWGFITFLFSTKPHPEPIDDETPIDRKRMLLGVITFAIGLACFTPVPFRVA